MTIRIAHLSDLHFGEKFNIALWRAVKDEIKRSKPELLIVSGDMVDHPSPIQLLAAKCELRSFAEGMNAKLIVVPGNHDVKSGGWWGRRKDWFERIFYNDDTSEAEAIAMRDFGEPLGFTEFYRSDPKPTIGLLDGLKRDLVGGSSFAAHLPNAPKKPLVNQTGINKVLVATLDSNSVGKRISFATGRVDDRELEALQAELRAITDPYFLRIAVIHHHVLPIAFAKAGRILGSEPLMVLHNAGTVLSILSEHRFDIVLHGHHHVAQFARLDLSPSDETGHTMAVVSAGCGALETENDAEGNCFNLITVAANGQIEVESFRYGGGATPNRQKRYTIYREPLTTTKRRASIRARERHSLHCRTRTQHYRITETGDLVIESTLEGLTTNDPTQFHHRTHSVKVARDGWFVDALFKPDRTFSSPGVKMTMSPASAPTSRGEHSRNFIVDLPDDSLRNGGMNYRVRYACANNFNMTRWECIERKGPENDVWDKEYVGFRVPHPIDVLDIHLQLPDSLRDVRPYLQCLAPDNYPAYELDANGDAKFQSDVKLHVDTGMTLHEASSLSYQLDTGTCTFRIEKPLVGYQYRVLWEPPSTPESLTIRTEVIDQRHAILNALSGRTSCASRWPARIARYFELFAEETERLLSRRADGENRSIEFFVYDSQETGLRPFLARRSWTTEPLAGDFLVPLGRGIAGVAFRQGRIVPWVKQRRSHLIEPIPYAPAPGEHVFEMHNILAIPICHPAYARTDRPPPWACIGVACFASTADGTRVARLLEPMDKELTEQILIVRGLAHAAIYAIIKSLEFPEEDDDKGTGGASNGEE